MLFAGIAGYGIYLSLTAARQQTPVHAAIPNQGDAGGFLLHVIGVDREASDPIFTGPGHLVKVVVTFENTTSSQQRADPADFGLQGQRAGSDVHPTHLPSGDCRQWQRADLYPPRGGGGALRDADAQRAGPTFGPVTLCFTPATTTGRLFLHWAPDIGLIGGDVRIPLRG